MEDSTQQRSIITLNGEYLMENVKQLEPFTPEWYAMIKANEGKKEKMEKMSKERTKAYQDHIRAICDGFEGAKAK